MHRTILRALMTGLAVGFGGGIGFLFVLVLLAKYHIIGWLDTPNGIGIAGAGFYLIILASIVIFSIHAVWKAQGRAQGMALVAVLVLGIWIAAIKIAGY